MMEKKSGNTAKTVIISILLIGAIFISFFYLGDICGSVESPWNSSNIATLNEKKANLLALTAGVTGVSVALTVLPDDTCTPIAEELSDLISYFALILSAIIFEEYLTTLTGILGFKILIPLGLLLILLFVLKFKNDTLRRTGIRLALFGLAIYLVIPLSCQVIKTVERTYDTSVQSTIDVAQEAINDLTGLSENSDENEKTGLFSKLSLSVSGIVDSALGKVKETINSCVESVALMIITCCFIPIGIILLLIWLIKIVLGIKVSSPDIRMIADRIPVHEETERN
ncbi:MAG: hypothetical protein Q4F31_04395 [Eubacteriales bacterium]|nr:hypothetical protein [Eubacteriales bacterium]